MTATMSRHLIVHQYCFQSSNSLWAVLHMPEEREQRAYTMFTLCQIVALFKTTRVKAQPLATTRGGKILLTR